MTRTRILVYAALLPAALAFLPVAAFAAEEGAKGPDASNLLGVFLAVLLALLGCVGIGATVLVLRIMLPGVAASADASIERVGTKRLMLAGVVPLVGAMLVAGGVGAVGNPVLSALYLLVVGLPLALLTLAGAVAAVPRIGAGALRGGGEASPLARAALGGLVLGLAMISWGIPPLGLLVSLLLSGWFLGTGIGICLPAAAGEPTETPVG